MNRNFYKVKSGPNVPPLGELDTAVYLLGALLSGGLVLGMLVVIAEYWDQMTVWAAPEALCTSTSSNWLLILAAFILPGSLCYIALERMEHRYPIFGNPGFVYGGEDWDPVYPAMLRDENAPPEVRKSVKDARFGLALWVLGLAAGLVLCLFELTGGTRLYPDGSVKTTVGFGEVTAYYAPEQIDRVFLKVDEPSSGRRGRSTWELILTLRTEDNKLIHFEVADFVTGEGESEIDRLRALLEQYPQELLRCENGEDLGRLYGRYQWDKEDQKYLEELLGAD